MLQRSLLEKDQLDCIDFIKSGEDSLIAADVGTGKTVISATAMVDDLEAGNISRALILAPTLVATDTWPKEFQEWEHLSNYPVAIAHGTSKAREAAFKSDAPFVVMNYENLGWMCEQYPRKRGKSSLPFDCITYDEVDKLKNVSGKRYKAFRNYVKDFRKRIGMSGTLIPNRLEEIWGSTYLVDAGQSFGRSFYKWREENFYATDYNQHNWEPFEETYREVLSILADLAYRLEAKGLPEVVMEEPYRMSFPADIAKLYKQLKREYIVEFDDKKVSGETAAIISGKLRQMAAGFSYVDGSKAPHWHTRQRFEWLDNVVLGRTLEREDQLLVVYQFKEELEELHRRHPRIPYLGGGVSNKKARDHIAAWNAGRTRLMAIHAQSASHGLNLQKSGARDIAMLTAPWSGGVFKQITGRLARRGQIQDEIYVHTAPFRGSVDLEVIRTLTDRMDQLNEFLGDLSRL
jgi:SNF2 family DNA or RNA helicase